MYQSVQAPQSVTIRDAGEFALRMRDACAGDADIAVDCAALADIDLSFLQIVVAARAELAASGRTLSLTAPDDGPLAALLQRAGFADDPAELQSWLKGTSPQ
jgi:hypothetical protein